MRKAGLLISAIILLQISLHTGDAQESDRTSTPDVARLMLAIMGADTPTVIPTPTATQPTPTASPMPTATPTAMADGCYPHDVAYVTRDTTIKARYGFTQPTVRTAEVGDQFDVTDSRLYGSQCWVETSAGWLYGPYLSAKPPTTTSDAPTAASSRCYPHDTVYATTGVSIRQEAKITAKRVRYTEAGEALRVTLAERDGDYCWLSVDEGWLFYGRLLSDEPVTMRSDVPSSASASCHSHDTVYARTSMNIREEPTYAAKAVGFTDRGEALDIISSELVAGACWLRIDRGWLRDSVLLLVEPLATSASGSCYPHGTAYIAGTMNIRASATTDSRVVAKAQAGNTFKVTESKRGETWCWLKISKGWLAKTGRVSATKPTITVATRSETVPTTQQSDIDNCCYVDRQCSSGEEWQSGYWAYQNNECGAPASSAAVSASLPGIDGPSGFVSKVTSAFNYLRDRAPNWFNYAVAKISSVGQHFGEGARAYVSRRRVDISPSSRYTGDVVVLSSILVHEACHIYQWDEGRRHSLDPTTREVECIQVQLDAVSQYAPAHRFISELRRLVRNPRVSYGF